VESKEFGASSSLLRLARDIGLDRALYSRPGEPWVRDSLAMIIGRIVYQGSKLSLSHLWDRSALWELCGIAGPIDVNTHCYASMDALLERQSAIQKHLAHQHLSNGCLVLYDITSTYFEGEYNSSDLVQFGYNRDGKPGHEQVVIGLITSAQGCPVAVEVFPGNTQDASTVAAKVKELKEDYGVKEIVLVGDRGMITASNEEKLATLPEAQGLKIISALTHREIVQLLAATEHQPELFDDKNIVEIRDPARPLHRFCLCRNPENAKREGQTRYQLLERTGKELDRIARGALKSQKTKRPASDEVIGARVGKILEKTKMGKYIQWKVQAGGELVWSVNPERVEADKALDGCYVIKTTVESMSKEDVVMRYKSLSGVEQAFRNLKTVGLEIRPVYHKTDDRIRAHVFICVLAYYLLWHAMKRLAPILDQQAAGLKSGKLKPEDRRWSLDYILETLKGQRQEQVEVAGVRYQQVTKPTPDQATLLALLNPSSKK
jgi:transposase